jgi:mono/diheme cytochrome c family protein
VNDQDDPALHDPNNPHDNYGHEVRPAAFLAPDMAVRPDASDFVEMPDVSVVPPQHEPLPSWLYVVCAVALFFAGSSYAGLELGEGYYDVGMGGPAESHEDVAQAAAPTDPMSLGKQLYQGNCANCHQASGAGQPGSYPPMVGSEYVLGNKEMLAAILLDGVQGSLMVKGGQYGTNVMPAWANLSDEKLADIMTYIRKSWGNTGDEVKPADVTAVRTKDASRATPWSSADLDKMKSGK